MAQQPKLENLKCANCAVKTDKGVLVSVRNEADAWSLMLCPQKVKEKLLSVGYAPTKIGEVYERFVENFASFPVCKQGEKLL